MHSTGFEKKGFQRKERLQDKVTIWITALFWTAGLLLAGSDGPLMPYLNGAGVVIFFLASLKLGRTLPQLDAEPVQGKPVSKIRPHGVQQVQNCENLSFGCSETKFTQPSGSAALSGAISPRYARELGVI